MKLSRKFAVSAATLAVAASATIAPAMADERPSILPGQTLSPEAAAAQQEAKKPSETEKAELTGKRLDNAKKGVETAKGIVDTLGGLNGLFGGGAAGGSDESSNEADC
ncbi:hypothetical protein [Corynebacterium lowii]|uniref:Uncharacterized protein n=1 Tax=Corynebacterium lowii TaxID=1544413 RepID=A0A0Q0YQN2_9CORY|nr:hypothetical protein [Corynebacterium lowii]KQB84753.1 hypothetical protein Clow_02011 [Corynebacterium lowii]MDP9851656.1 hypothetical protein [Corynebacterium lowii]